MNTLKALHKAQFRAKILEMFSHPGVLSESECIEIMKDIISELMEGEEEYA